MLLKSLKLKDFRQFYGEQCITFSADPKKNVTVIMGENGSGKTTLAQAFTWCLYGETSFIDKDVLCKKTEQDMPPKTDDTVEVELILVHSDFEYTVTRKQKYSKDNSGKIKRDNTTFSLAYKGNDGQQEFVKPLETEKRLKEILPHELSRYFFFDGERIESMGKELRRGKSPEFREAVKSLLGLDAFLEAIEHLGGKSQNTVIKNYNKSYDSSTDSRIGEYTLAIEEMTQELDAIDDRFKEIEDEETLARDKISDLTEQIGANAHSVELEAERKKLINQLPILEKRKVQSTTDMLRVFNEKAQADFAKKLVKDALHVLKEAEKLDIGIPDIRDRTIEYLIERGSCICGTEIKQDSVVYKNLQNVLNYIPPKAIGSSIGEFINECAVRTKVSMPLYDEIAEKYATVRDFEDDYAEIIDDIKLIEEKLKNMKNVGKLQEDRTRYEKILSDLKSQSDSLHERKGVLEVAKQRKSTERDNLAIKNENNNKIRVFKAYAVYLHGQILKDYKKNEEEVRTKLKETINTIFKSIYNGGFSLDIDEKYNIQVLAEEYQGTNSGELETSTAQNISIIFAFISAVIQLARDSQQSESKMLKSEPYPLVMDAPLSAFDKTRIKTVCETLPHIAEQVIIFIKNTDGELAEEYLAHKLGARYVFDKINEIETQIVVR